MSRDTVLQAMLDRAKAAGSVAYDAAKSGANVGYHAGAGLVGAPQGASSQGSSKQGSFRTTGNFRPGVDPALMSAIESAATKNGYIVEAYSGKNPRSTGTVNHPSGRATDIRIIDPATGKALGGVDSPHMNPSLFRQYEAFANDVHKEFVAANPTRANQFRWGGYFVQGTPMDLMHFDVSGGNMAAGNFKKGLSPQYAKLWGVPGTSPVQANAGATSSGDPQVAAMQRVLNSRGANIVVDGIMGPLTRGALAKYGPQAPAQAYAPVPAASPAQQAVAGQSYGRPDPQVAAMQRDLNSRGAQLKVDGLRGPLTRAAEKQFLGSPTSVRTPSFTAARTPSPYTAATPQTPGFMNPYSSPTVPQTPSYAPPTDPRLDALRQRIDTEGFSAIEKAMAVPQTPSIHQPYSNPYTSSTGGANAIVASRQVPTSSIKAGPLPGVQLPSYNQGITYPSAIQAGAKPVATAAVSAGRNGPFGNVWGGFDRPAINPYTSSTGGANAIVQPVQTARMPQARPAYPPPVQQAGPTLMQQLHDKMQRDAAAASQNSRSGMNYSGGGGYTGGSYGGYGGGSITSGVGGAFRNR